MFFFLILCLNNTHLKHVVVYISTYSLFPSQSIWILRVSLRHLQWASGFKLHMLRFLIPLVQSRTACDLLAPNPMEEICAIAGVDTEVHPVAMPHHHTVHSTASVITHIHIHIYTAASLFKHHPQSTHTLSHTHKCIPMFAMYRRDWAGY